MDLERDSLLYGITDIVRDAGRLLLDAVNIEESVEKKSGRANFVTRYDKQVQEFLFERLGELVPEAVFIGEEEEQHAQLPASAAFIIDPIDGTTNFMKNYQVSCISVALLQGGIPLAGVIYNPYLDELFTAWRGNGAFLNGSPIRVSDHSLKEGLVLLGTAPYNPELSQQTFTLAYELFKRSLDIRRSGSAALDLCSIACGRAELFFELLLSPWDFAAGALLVREAGGEIRSVDGEMLSFDRKQGIVAGTPEAIRQWRKLF